MKLQKKKEACLKHSCKFKNISEFLEHYVLDSWNQINQILFSCLCLCIQSLKVLLQHPDDNRNQIRELAQTLMDGGVLDELIQQKLEAFNTRWDELMARVREYISEFKWSSFIMNLGASKLTKQLFNHSVMVSSNGPQITAHGPETARHVIFYGLQNMSLLYSIPPALDFNTVNLISPSSFSMASTSHSFFGH